jgi:hypothetical protein
MPDPFAQFAVAQEDPFAAFAAAAAPDPRVVAEQDRLDPDTAGLRRIYAANPGLRESVSAELDQAADELPWAIGGAALSAVLPGVLEKAAPYAPGAVRAVAKVVSSPATSGAVGAAEGYRRGGVWGALTGGASGYGIAKGLGALAGAATRPKAPNVAAGMSQAGRAAAAKAPVAQAETGQPVLDALLRGAKYDELAAMPSVAARIAKAPAPTAPAAPQAAPKATTGASALVDEVAARQKLADPINWRTTDATPIKKPGKGIHFGEESTPGLLKLLQDALMAKNAPLAEKIQTAIRQRSHITGKVGEP